MTRHANSPQVFAFIRLTLTHPWPGFNKTVFLELLKIRILLRTNDMKWAFPAILMMLFWLPAHTQQIIVNSNGDRIVMYPDGSWRSAEAGDSVLLRNLQKSEPIGYLSESDIPSRELNPGEYEDYILRQWNELHFNILAQEKKIQAEFRAATNAQFKARELLGNAEANKSMIEPDRLAQLNEDFDRR